MTVKNETVLIVEDDTQIRNFIAYTIKQEGFSFRVAGTAQQALSILVSDKIDLMLLDLGLPDFDGMEVIEKVRSWSEIPIIVVSARDQDKEKAAALDAGADDYLTKPFSATELMARVRVAIRHLHKTARTQIQPEISVGELTIDPEKRQVFLKGTALTVTADCTLTEAMFDFASSLGTVGLSIGITGPNTNDATLIVEMIGMLLGRLEIFIVVIGLTFGFGRLKDIFRKKKKKRCETASDRQ